MPTRKSQIIFICPAGQSDAIPHRKLSNFLEFCFGDNVQETNVNYAANVYEAGIVISNTLKRGYTIAAVVQAENPEILPETEMPETSFDDEARIYNDLGRVFENVSDPLLGVRTLDYLKAELLKGSPKTRLVLFTGRDGMKQKIPESLDGIMRAESSNGFSLTLHAEITTP